MPIWLQTTVTIVVAVFASTGFWSWVQRRGEKKDARTKKLLKRLAALRGKERERLPRPAVFEDKKKYRREREKTG